MPEKPIEQSEQSPQLNNDPDRIDLKLNWQSINEQELLAALKKFDQIKVAEKEAKTLYQQKINSVDGTDVVLTVQKAKGADELDVLQFSLIDESQSTDYHNRFYRYIADFDFTLHPDQETEVWDMKHRRTSSHYRKQGIAGNIIGLTEKFLRSRKAEQQKQQVISCNHADRQLGEWLKAKHGFQVAPEDRPAWQRITSDDPDIITTSAPVNPNDTPSEQANRSQNYLFDFAKFQQDFPELDGPEDPKVWQYYNKDECPYYHYSKSSIRINMWKEVA